MPSWSRYAPISCLRPATMLIVLATLTGCGGGADPTLPELLPVSGFVMQGGKPVEGVVVVFEPEQGSLSMGATDESGRFELQYSQEHRGAVPGMHRVRLSKFSGEAGDELIPRKYNELSDITREVKEGGPNEFKFEI